LRIFLDTSAFAKLYVQELGSQKVVDLLADADEIAVSVICLPELISTLSRLVRENNLKLEEFLKIKSKALADLEDALIVQLGSSVLLDSILLLESNPLRAMDAIHIACAKAIEVELFVSADHRQLAAAKKSGLKVLDVS